MKGDALPCRLKPVSLEDGEKALRYLAEINGKTVEEMRKFMDECGDHALAQMELQDKAGVRLRLLAKKVSPRLKSNQVFVVVIDSGGTIFSDLDDRENWTSELSCAKKFTEK